MHGRTSQIGAPSARRRSTRGQEGDRRLVERFLNRGLPPQRRITLRTRWPLFFFPLLLIMQLIGPSPIWVALIVGLLGFYGLGYAWVRVQVEQIHLERRREGSMLVMGDSLQERFVVRNESSLPLLWLEFHDSSLLPGYRPSQVVSCGGGATYQWRAEAVCQQRGVFRLGPYSLRTGDPFGLYRVTIAGSRSETLLVYPRVAYLPPLNLPHGNLSGRDRRRRPLMGAERAPVVRAYRAGDSLRYVHWPSTAHRGDLMVTELETEPSGDLWIVLDLDARVHRGIKETSTLEYSIVLAASVAAELLGGSEARAVGLLAAGGHGEMEAPLLLDLPPAPGKGQIWPVLAALAPVQAGRLSLAELLAHSRDLFSSGQTVLVITPDMGSSVADWTAELLHLRRGGVAASVLSVVPAADDAGTKRARLAGLLTRYDIPVHFLDTGTPLEPVLTYRRRRTVLRTTPTGGVVAYEVEEEVG